MRRATKIRSAGDWNAAAAVDRVLLDADERRRRRIMLTGEKGTVFLLDLSRPPALHDGDGLVLDDGGIVRVVGRPEQLVEIAADRPQDRLRIAWHLGNRHTEVQVAGEKLRIRRDHVLEAMLTELGACLTFVEAPFDPERGAYAHDHDDAALHASPHHEDHGT
jgi:urease accessory protein